MKLSVLKISDGFFIATILMSSSNFPNRAEFVKVRGRLIERGVDDVEVIIDDNPKQLCDVFINNEIQNFLERKQ